MSIQRSETRGGADYGWLKTKHSFSFGSYYNRARMGFGPLRVINEDEVAPGRGFDAHPHSDMEILSYVVSGKLTHQDSLGSKSTIFAGQVQKLSAGSGIIHSEYNGSKEEPVKFLQIWIEPNRAGVAPSYDEGDFSEALKNGELVLIASPSGENGSMRLLQDARVWIANTSTEKAFSLEGKANTQYWVQVVSGELVVNEEVLSPGDGFGLREVDTLHISTSQSGAHFLVFELPKEKE
ncbi:MAG: pirin family protein [Bdellovibrionales bacterium]|nr:pirin family protein [Bdellovibrionales bacterium]